MAIRGVYTVHSSGLSVNRILEGRCVRACVGMRFKRRLIIMRMQWNIYITMLL